MQAKRGFEIRGDVARAGRRDAAIFHKADRAESIWICRAEIAAKAEPADERYPMVDGPEIFADDRGRAASQHRDRVPFRNGGDIVRVEHIARHHLNRNRQMVEGAVLGDFSVLGEATRSGRGARMDMGVDETRDDDTPTSVDFLIEAPSIVRLQRRHDAVGYDHVISRQ